MQIPPSTWITSVNLHIACYTWSHKDARPYLGTKVATGQVHPGNMVNGHPLPLGYATVTLDTLAKEMYDTVEMEMTMDDDRSTLAAILGSLVP